MTHEGFVYNRVFESAEEMTEWLQLVADAPKLATQVKALEQFEDDVRDILDGMGSSEFYASFDKALRRLMNARKEV